jgi:type I restriction enzyme R subunit
MTPLAANREAYGLIRSGIGIEYEHPDNDEFLAVTQLWIKGDRRYRRPDLLIYINGIPLVFIEFKNSNVSLKNAYDDNIQNYRMDIPRLFAYNGLCVLSNAMQTKIGSFSASWEFFYPWLRVDDEREKVDRDSIKESATSLELLIRGLFPKERLLDYIENFIVFYGEKIKIVAQNHQFLGVNKAIASFEDRKSRAGRLGVFWHTQGSGKSFSMIFLAGNYTFLGRNLRVVFTLIQKFRYDKGKEYPVLSEREDIIVIVDEAHRTQYAGLAENMRKGLPNAQFYAFTGTPILGEGKRLHKGKTFEWFGDYVSEYNFQQSVDDGATVPLFYQKRVPEVLIQNESLGKGMVISVDKYTAVKMHDKVQALWKEGTRLLVGEIAKTREGPAKDALKRRLEYMRGVEMAVVVSEDAGEAERFAKLKLDIKPHRDRMDALDARGHDIEDQLQLVFVCAMWLTGFDAPTVSTLYLDKPMKGHTLMQAIARANRVSSFQIGDVTKANGEVIDYYNVFRSMKKALADYAIGEDDGEEDEPVQDKANLIALLDEALAEGLAFCSSVGVDLAVVTRSGDTFNKLGRFEAFADSILARDETRKEFKVYENSVSSLYEASKPEVLSSANRPVIAAFRYLRGVIESIIDRADIDDLRIRIGELLDQSVVTANGDLFARERTLGFPALKSSKALNLGELDFAKLRAEFRSGPYRNIEIVALRDFIEKKLVEMLKENSTRVNFIESLQKTIDAYNAGGTSTEDYFDELMRHVRSMKEEEERHAREGLTEDELELYDILKKPKMTQGEEVKVKNAAKRLLQRLKEEEPRVLVRDWFKERQAQERVKSALEEVLDAELPKTYDRALFSEKSRKIFELILNYSAQGAKWTA